MHIRYQNFKDNGVDNYAVCMCMIYIYKYIILKKPVKGRNMLVNKSLQLTPKQLLVLVWTVENHALIVSHKLVMCI